MTNIYNSDILISINPTFIDLIFEQKKIYEYRKSIFRKKISTVYVYGTRPISKVIAKFNISQILCGTREELWQQTKHGAGIQKELYMKYFEKNKICYAIGIIKFSFLSESYDLYSFCGRKHAPQNFIYLSESVK